MKNGGAEQCLLKAAEGGEMSPREALYPGLDRFHGDMTRRSCFPGHVWRTVGGGHKATRLFPGPTPTAGTLQQVGGGAARSPPGGRDTEGRQEFGGRSTLCGSCWGPSKAAPPPPPAARRIFFWSGTSRTFRPWLSPHTSTSWTPQGSSLGRDCQECVTGPIIPSIKGPFRLGPTARPDRAPFLEPGSN
jgi:hypothetical protein